MLTASLLREAEARQSPPIELGETKAGGEVRASDTDVSDTRRRTQYQAHVQLKEYLQQGGREM